MSGAVKLLACSVCDGPAPSDAHHIKQGRHFTVALCKDCHQGSNNGWHGEKFMWRIHKDGRAGRTRRSSVPAAAEGGRPMIHLTLLYPISANRYWATRVIKRKGATFSTAMIM
ncbi:hypothetical protein [Stenotrophomonas sp. PS02301]|uniref:hypothetical protein n=1 Tax=Stenotrophomonas sp. PS02301 TaxID=2991427 RepID=UPI00249C540C|nr:hypothetical protein [Stenotrophomonas sp. PS02301]